MNITRIHHVAILTSNDLYDSCKNFYSSILGFKIIRETFRDHRNSYKLDLEVNGGTQIELFSFPEYKERASYPEAKGLRHLSFEVTNIETAVEHLRSNGIEAEAIRLDELTGRRFTFFNDPNGQPLELYEI